MENQSDYCILDRMFRYHSQRKEQGYALGFASLVNVDTSDMGIRILALQYASLRRGDGQCGFKQGKGLLQKVKEQGHI